MPNKTLNILFIADIMGRPGRQVTQRLLPEIKKEFEIDLVIANGENSAGGFGINKKVYNELTNLGIEAFTMGNHIWEKKEFVADVSPFERVVKPANYPPDTPGKDYLLLKVKDTRIAIINLLGRVFMKPMDCPFRVADALIEKLKDQAKIIIVDIHAEATSEKLAMGYYLDGRVSAVLGTHTHVQSADERILAGGTGFICDAGMVGAQNSVIGMNKEQILSRFLTGMPSKFEVETKGPGIFNAVLLTIDTETGKCLEIKRIKKTIDSITD